MLRKVGPTHSGLTVVKQNTTKVNRGKKFSGNGRQEKEKDGKRISSVSLKVWEK